MKKEKKKRKREKRKGKPRERLVLYNKQGLVDHGHEIENNQMLILMKDGGEKYNRKQSARLELNAAKATKRFRKRCSAALWSFRLCRFNQYRRLSVPIITHAGKRCNTAHRKTKQTA
jgi:hypothetical protein